MDAFLQRYPPTPEVFRDEPDSEAGGAPPVPVSPRRIPVERTLDLHGCTVEEARIRLDAFIQSALSDRVVKVLIIHGKGNHSDSGSVIRNFVRNYLERNRFVGATGTPSVREGGTGATWAIIRQRSR
ncbi:MAG: hypothetical protein EA427_16465 [Spirochaetaceae bacterium]|nr:MAG: hypothetical protein EA427_16465 [Spirochaetaceae bacterium]